MTIFKNLPKEFVAYLITIIPVIVYVIKLTIDNWGITELEKLRLSNFKKFQIALTKYVFVGIIFVASMYLILANQFNDIKEDMIYGMLALFFIIFIVIIFIFEKFLKFIVGILSFQYDYHIVNDQGVPVYRIIKLSGNNSLLVESNGIEEFLDVKENRKYKRIRRKSSFLEKFYGGKTSRNCIIGLAFLGIISFLLVYFTKDWWQFGFYIIFIIVVLSIVILFQNYIENKKYIESLPANSADKSQ